MSRNYAYFAPLVTLPKIITAPGKYLTRCGETVMIDAASPKPYFNCSFDCHGRYSDGIIEHWHSTGRIYATSETKNDIVKPKPRRSVRAAYANEHGIIIGIDRQPDPDAQKMVAFAAQALEDLDDYQLGDL